MKWVRQWPRGHGEGVESRWRPALVLPQQPWLRLIHHADCIALAFCLLQDWSQNLTLHLKNASLTCFPPSSPSLPLCCLASPHSPHIYFPYLSLPLTSSLQSYFHSTFFSLHDSLCWFLTFIFSYSLPKTSHRCFFGSTLYHWFYN